MLFDPNFYQPGLLPTGLGGPAGPEGGPNDSPAGGPDIGGPGAPDGPGGLNSGPPPGGPAGGPGAGGRAIPGATCGVGPLKINK